MFIIDCGWQERLGGLAPIHTAHHVRCHLVSCVYETPKLISASRDVYDLLALGVIKQTAWDLDAVPFLRKERVEHCLCAVFHSSDGPSCLDFERHSTRAEKGFFLVNATLGNNGLDARIQFSFKTVSGRPYVLFDVMQKADGEK